MTKTKVIDLNENYNFIVDDIFFEAIYDPKILFNFFIF